MRLVLKNIGIIESADIELQGLTVIAGSNDTGKSTVGKIAYSLTKAYEDFEVESQREKSRITLRLYRELYSLLRREIAPSKSTPFMRIFNNINFFHADTDVVPKLVKEIRESLESIKIGPSIKTKIIAKIVEIEKVYAKEETKNDKIVKVLTEVLRSEFRNQITNLNSDTATISIQEGENPIVSIAINNNNITVEPRDRLFPFESSILIETPFVLQYQEAIAEGETHHITDLLRRLMNSAIINIKEESAISAIIEGRLSYSELDDHFEFKKNINGRPYGIKIQNVASGIRNFGILQLLERAGEFNKNLLLIIDEPEIHLHPEWQVEYARVLVQLIKKRIKVLVTSHSPYLIEALNKFSRVENLTDQTRFYLAEKCPNGNAIIKDKTKEKDEIFAKLSKPFERLIFEK